MLKYSRKKSITPDVLVKNISDYEGKPINVRQQMDVDEFLLGFFDSLERNLQKLRRDQIVDQLFMGKVYQEIVGVKCGHTSSKEDKFLAVSLATKRLSSLHEALEHYIRWETLEGENSYFCESCGQKVMAKKRISFSNLPNILIVVLKRFEFDSRNMQAN